MSKILVLGNSGSGKSTFTKKLAEKLNYDYLHLDTIIYKHSWNKPEFDEMERKISEFLPRS